MKHVLYSFLKENPLQAVSIFCSLNNSGANILVGGVKENFPVETTVL